MRIPLEIRKKQYRIIYELLHENPRIQYNEIGKRLEIGWRTAKNRMKEAFDKGYVYKPQIRKKSYANFREYMYFLTCEDPVELYKECIKDNNVIYHAVMDGFANFWIISKEEIDIEGDIAIKGPRSDFYISFAPDHSWDEAVKIMHKMVKNFDPAAYTPRGIVETHWAEPIEWNEQDEILFQEFKYDLRKPLEPIVKDKHKMWSGNAYEWLKRLPECSTVFTCYFPETSSGYDPYIFMFETEYEDFIIDLFSQLPTSSWFFKVSGVLFLHLWVDRGSMRSVDFHVPTISKLHIPILLGDLARKNIVRKRAHAIVQCYWRDDFGIV
jgi:predicted transcriptional regulator